jgi:hypothetical protein
MATISCHGGTSVSKLHNERDEKTCSKEPHIDLSRPHENWLNKDVKEAYNEFFGEAVEKYNNKQERSNRQISSYYDKIRDSKNKNLVYEVIVGVYDNDTPTSTKREILKEFVDNWETRNPTLKLVGAYYHDDEQGQSPHVHIDYVPVASGYKRGMSVQNSLTKALEQNGYSRKNHKETPQIQWFNAERSYLEKLCNERGITVEHKLEKREHINTSLYKEMKQQTELNEAKLQEDISTLEDALKSEEYSKMMDVYNKIEDDITPPRVKTIPFSKEEYVPKKDFDNLANKQKSNKQTISRLFELILSIIRRFREVLRRKDEEIKHLQNEIGALKKMPYIAKSNDLGREVVSLRRESKKTNEVLNKTNESLEMYKRGYQSKDQEVDKLRATTVSKKAFEDLENAYSVLYKERVELSEQFNDLQNKLSNVSDYLKDNYDLDISDIQDAQKHQAYDDYEIDL